MMDSFNYEEPYDYSFEEDAPGVRWQPSQLNPLLQRLVGGNNVRGDLGQRTVSADDVYSRDWRSRTPVHAESTWEGDGPSTSSGGFDSPQPMDTGDESLYDIPMPFTLTALARKATPMELGQSKSLRSQADAEENGKGRASLGPSLSRKPSLMDIDDELPSIRSLKKKQARNSSIPPPEMPSESKIKSKDRRSGRSPKLGGKIGGVASPNLARKPSLVDVKMDSPHTMRKGDPSSMPPPPVPPARESSTRRLHGVNPSASTSASTSRAPITKSRSIPNVFPQPPAPSTSALAASRSHNSVAPSSSSTNSERATVSAPPPDPIPPKVIPAKPSQGPPRPTGRPPVLGMRRATAPYGTTISSQHDAPTSSQLPPSTRKAFKAPRLVTKTTSVSPPIGQQHTPVLSKRSTSTSSASSFTSNSTMFSGGSRPSSQTSEEGDAQPKVTTARHVQYQPKFERDRQLGGSVGEKDDEVEEEDEDGGNFFDDPNDDSYGDLLGLDCDTMNRVLSAYD